METKTVTMTQDEAEDIRFALARLADDDESRASFCGIGSEMGRRLLEQAERFRALARKVTT